MLEIIAAFLLIFWSLGLISGVAVSSAVHILPVIALTAIVLKVYDIARSRTREHVRAQHQQVTPLHAAQASAGDASAGDAPRPAHEHAKAA